VARRIQAFSSYISSTAYRTSVSRFGLPAAKKLQSGQDNPPEILKFAGSKEENFMHKDTVCNDPLGIDGSRVRENYPFYPTFDGGTVGLVESTDEFPEQSIDKVNSSVRSFS
jgi:hypothetical protein